MGVVKHTENLTNNDENELWEKGVIYRQLQRVLTMVCSSITQKYLDCAV